MESPDFITAEWLEKVLQESEGSPHLKVQGVHTEKGCNKGDGYAGKLLTVDVTATVHSVNRKFHLMVKCLPESPFQKKWLFQTKSFLKEANTYTVIIPQMLEFQNRHGMSKSDSSLAFPKCYYANSDNVNDVIVLENLKMIGYRHVDKIIGPNFDHCKLVMEEIAKFHALSFAMKREQPEALIEKYTYLEDYFFSNNIDMFATISIESVQNMAAMLKNIPGQENNAEKLLSTGNKECFMKAMELKYPKEPMALIIHGDLWSNNILFHYDDEDNPDSVMILDLQRVEYSNPMIDLIFFFYCSTTPALRQQHLQKLLEIYHFSFMNNLKSFSISLPDYTFENMFHDFKTSLLYGLFLACGIVPNVILAKPEDIIDLSEGEFVESIKTALDNKKESITVSASDALKERIVGLVEEMVEFGII